AASSGLPIDASGRVMLSGLMLAMQMRAAPSTRQLPAGATTASLIAQARRAETEFFYLWRREWETHLAVNGSDLRLMSLHCHADGSWVDRPAPHLISTPFSRKSMCPIWLDPSEGERPDESAGIDNALSDGARKE